jgi:hypothetical protein
MARTGLVRLAILALLGVLTLTGVFGVME